MKLLICLLLFLVDSVSAGWLDRKAEGWAWYEDRLKKEIKKEEKIQTASEKMAGVRKSLEDKLAAAVLMPSEENVLQYMLEQQKWMNQSSKFSKTWETILLNHPSLNYSATTFPVSQYGLQLHKQIVQEETESFIKHLSVSHGLFFFYKGKEKTSQAFAYVVREFFHKYKWNVIGISVDGEILEGFPNSKLDNGISKKFNVELFPSLFVVDPLKHDIRAISFGLASLDQIEINIMTQFKEELDASN